MTPIPIPTASLGAAAAATLMPLVAFGIVMIFTRSRPAISAGLSIAASAGAVGCALFLLVRHWDMATPMAATGRWLASGTFVLPVGFLLDPTSLLMFAVVAVVCFLVQVYSVGYMAGDRGFSRYYAFMSLFAWAMLSLTLSPTLLQLYIFWELVGLSSYLLIGFWYEKFSASEAGKKAFVMTRLGDVAFFLGLLLVLLNLGNVNILDINSTITQTRLSPPLLTAAVLLIFGGIIGKSAQFPLLTWLPDAMEGPTPVSALLHSATMVAAGVFLFARLFPFFSLSPTAMTVCMVIGTVSMLLASTMAIVARDIKQVWAYSTISQLGFMIMGLSAGSLVAGVFHLTTHAFFKAMLFLCSGVFIHAYGTNDMFEIGRRGGRGMKIPMICMIIAAAALTGLPPFSGYFSKEMIMGTLAEHGNPLWLAAGLLGALLTAYYTFRLIFIVAFPRSLNKPGPEPHEAHGHGTPGWVMNAPLVVLGAVTLVLGFGQAGLERFLLMGVRAGGGHHAWLPYAAVGLTAAGIALAWLEFGRGGASQVGFVERMPAVNALFADRWYLDRFWRWFLNTVIYRLISRLCAANERTVIDGSIDGMSAGTVEAGRFLSRVQTGMVQYRLVVMFIVVVLLGLYYFV
ncbi:MAG: NADH-quinone oxidoreductase subunit L [Desulfobacterales bacterium]